jgi:putative SOS response-associated peptidase YedK
MCNLYQMTPKEDFERFIRQMELDLAVPEYDASRPVGPFGAGLFFHACATGLRAQVGQWGMIRPGQPERIDYIQPKSAPGKKPPAKRPRSTNNARIESIDSKPTFAAAWRTGHRCLIPATWYAEPNWETGKNVWWHLRRDDGAPWFLAGLWNEWTDPQTGEVVLNFTMITCNCTGHQLLGRLHRPELDPATRTPLPAEKQDKRSLIHIDPRDWEKWFHGSGDDALALIAPQPATVFDQTDARNIDALLGRSER